MEFLDIVDEYGVPTGEIVERGTAHREGIRHRTSHVWLLRNKDGEIQILLQKRCMEKDSFPGCYDISSAGHIPAGYDFRESAIRELKEELGLEASEEELIFCGDRIIIWDDCFRGIPYHDNQYSRVFIIRKDVEAEDMVFQPEEVEGVLWMNLEECIEAVKANTINHCICLEELSMVQKGIEESKVFEGSC